MPSTSVCHSLPSPSLSLFIFAYACLLPSFRLKKVIYFTLTLTSTLFTPSTFCPPISVPSPSHYHYQLLRLPWRHRKLMMILIDAFALALFHFFASRVSSYLNKYLINNKDTHTHTRTYTHDRATYFCRS